MEINGAGLHLSCVSRGTPQMSKWLSWKGGGLFHSHTRNVSLMCVKTRQK